jgi:hypothetical protein
MMHALSGVGGVIPPSGANRKSGRQTISFFFWLYARKGNCNCLRRGAISGKKGDSFQSHLGMKCPEMGFQGKPDGERGEHMGKLRFFMSTAVSRSFSRSFCLDHGDRRTSSPLVEVRE